MPIKFKETNYSCKNKRDNFEEIDCIILRMNAYYVKYARRLLIPGVSLAVSTTASFETTGTTPNVSSAAASEGK